MTLSGIVLQDCNNECGNCARIDLACDDLDFFSWERLQEECVRFPKNPTGAFLLRGQVDTSNEPAGFNF
jgi:hypothetical protein